MNTKSILALTALVALPLSLFADKSANQAWVSNHVETAIINKVRPWARALNKPTYTAAEIEGVLKVDTAPTNDVNWSSIGIKVAEANAKVVKVESGSNKTLEVDATNNVGKLKGTWKYNDKEIATTDDLNTLSNNLVTAGIGGGGTGTVDPDDIKELISSNIVETSTWTLSNGEIPWTEHPVKVTIAANNAPITVSGNWPETKCVFVYFVFNGGTSFVLPANMKLVGYYAQPTENFQAIVWKLDGFYYMNVISKTE